MVFAAFASAATAPLATAPLATAPLATGISPLYSNSSAAVNVTVNGTVNGTYHAAKTPSFARHLRLLGALHV